jgi:hypothetical protein
MRIPRTEIVDFEEYKVLINYDGKGGIEVSVLDELGDEIEGLYISDAEDDIDEGDITDFDINMN